MNEKKIYRCTMKYEVIVDAENEIEAEKQAFQYWIQDNRPMNWEFVEENREKVEEK